MEKDKEFIKRCIELSKQSVKKGDKPFGCVITKNNKIVAEALNESEKRIPDHAEIVALNKASSILRTKNLSKCTLYSNFEPCPMCAFMIREFKIKRVVFAIPSKYMGGYTRWNILGDKTLAKFRPFFSKPPEVVSGVLRDEARKVFNKAALKMFSIKLGKVLFRE